MDCMHGAPLSMRKRVILSVWMFQATGAGASVACFVLPPVYDCKGEKKHEKENRECTAGRIPADIQTAKVCLLTLWQYRTMKNP